MDDRHDVELATTLAEIHRENKEWVDLVFLYGQLGNEALRDKYIEKAIADGVHPSTEAYFRSLQGRRELIDQEGAEKALAELEEKEIWMDHARLLYSLGRPNEAAHSYVRDILQSFDEGEYFSAAFYLKELVDRGLIQSVYLAAFDEATKRDDLWWQIRVLEDLEWTSVLEDLVLQGEPTLDDRKDLNEGQKMRIRQLAARARGDRQAFLDAAVAEATLRVPYAGPPPNIQEDDQSDSGG